MILLAELTNSQSTSVIFTSPVLGALVGAILGGLIASYLKEFFGDVYHKKRRLREIITEMTRSIGLFDHDYQMYCRESNHLKLHVALSKTISISPSLRDRVPELRKQHEQNALALEPGTESFFQKATTHWATITALSYETQHYINSKKYKKLRKVHDAFFERVKANTEVSAVKEMDYATLLTYLHTDFGNAIDKLNEIITNTSEHFIRDINNLLKS